MARQDMTDELGRILIQTTESVNRSEEEGAKRLGRGDLTAAEVHLMERIASAKGGKSTVSDLAKALDVTMPTVTVAVNRLEKKGYIKKTKNSSDARSVFISLTEEGAKMNKQHEDFQEQMIFNVVGDFSDEELAALCKCLRKLNNHMNKSKK